MTSGVNDHFRRDIGEPYQPSTAQWHLFGISLGVSALGVLFLFYWNRLLAWLMCTILRLLWWTSTSDKVWVECESLHISLITGRITLKDFRYHTSNQSIRILKLFITWRYWLWRTEEHIEPEVKGEAERPNAGQLPCRVRLHLEGVEWFMYNRMPMYDDLLAKLSREAESRPPAEQPRRPAQDPSSAHTRETFNTEASLNNHPPRSNSRRRRIPAWLAAQIPTFNFNDILPIAISASRGAILVGNPSTSTLVVLQFKKGNGEYGIGLCSNPVDVYRQIYSFRFRTVSIRNLPNPDYRPQPLAELGAEVINHFQASTTSDNTSLRYIDFWRLIQRLPFVPSAIPLPDISNLGRRKSRFTLLRESVNVREDPPRSRKNSEPPKPTPIVNFWDGLMRYVNEEEREAAVTAAQVAREKVEHEAAEERTRRQGEFRQAMDRTEAELETRDDEVHRAEYAIEPLLLDATALEVRYYVDVPGRVPERPLPAPAGGTLDSEPVDIGNGGGLSPQWRVELVITNGTINYGPWADRSRALLQKVLSPPSYQDAQPARRLQPDEQRVHVCLEVLVQLTGHTTLRIPTRQASQDWRYERGGDLARFRASRTGANLSCRIGEGSTINYIMPLVATDARGYPTKLTVSLRDLAISSSFNESRFLSARACRVICALPSPLQWNAPRQWTFDITLNNPVIHLLRDHVALLTDLGKDWASGPPTDPRFFVPMTYVARVALVDYQLFMFLNDHNIVNFPFVQESNALLRLNGPSLHSETIIPSSTFRSESTDIKFWVEIPKVQVGLTLPNWNTQTFHASPVTTEVGTIGLVRLDASYLYFASVRPEHVEVFKLNIQARNAMYKCFGWTIRHFMVLQNNYFGAFTNYSTVAEYLGKRAKDQPVGDPVDLKYRPGKANVLQVILDLDVQDAVVVCPEGLPGYERYDPASTSLGSCLVFDVPELQVHLVLHDYAMELSLNLQPISGSIDPNWTPASVTFRPNRQASIISIDGIDIIANRLFGPQPRTTTYVCIWEINIGAVKADLTPDQANSLATAAATFGNNFSDDFNSPADQYQPIYPPDVTFLKVSLASLHATWHTGSVALCISLLEGLRLSLNDLAGSRYRSVVSVEVPDCQVRCLLASSATSQDTWLEAASLNLDVGIDIYSAPSGWRESAQLQRECLIREDAPTRRIAFLYETEPSNDHRRTCSYVHSIFLPHPQLPSLPTPPPDVAPTLRSPTFRRRRRANSLDSDEDVSRSDADRDARIARSRPPTPMRSPFVDESMSSGDESDNDDDFDSESSATESAVSDSDGDGPRIEHYLHVVRRYRFIGSDDYDLPFVLAKDSIPFESSPSFGRVPLKKSSQESPGILDSGVDDNVTSISLSSRRGFDVIFTPLCIHVARHVLPALFNSPFPSLELQVDDFIRKTISMKNPVPDPKRMTLQLAIPSIRLRSLQSIMSTDEADIFDGPRLPTLLPTHSRIVSIVDARLNSLHFLGSWGGGTSRQLTVTGEFNQAHIDVGTIISHSVPQMRSRPPRIPESVFHVSIEASQAQAATGKIDVLIGDIDVRMGDRAPETCVSSAEAIGIAAQEIATLSRRHSKWAAAKARYMVWAVLTRTQNIAPSDPLSHTRPSFLVQSGRPQELRTDVSWKVLDHARFCLRFMAQGDRQGLFKAVENINRPIPDIVAADIETLLTTQWRDWTPDVDQASIYQLPLFQLLFPRLAPPEPSSDFPLRDGSIRTNRVMISLVGDPAEENTLDIGPATLTAAFHLHTVVPIVMPSSSLSLNRPQPSSSNSVRNLGHLILHMAFTSLQLSIYPTFIPFLRRLIVVRRRGRNADRPQTPLDGKTNKAPRSPLSRISCELVLEAGALGLMAAAGHFAFDAKLLQTVIALTCAVPIPFPSREITSGAISFIFNEGTFQARDLSSYTHVPLAEVRLIRGKFTGAAQQNDAAGQLLRGIFALDAIALQVPKNAIRLLNSVKEWYIQYFKLKLNPLWQSLMAEIVKDEKPPPPRPTAPVRRTVDLQFIINTVEVELQIWLGSWLSWRISGTTAFLLQATGRNPTYGIEIPSQVINWIHRSRPSIPTTETQNFKVKLPTFRSSGTSLNGRIRAIASVDFFKLTLKPNYADSLLVLQQKLGDEFYELVDWFSNNMPSSSNQAGDTPTSPTKSSRNTLLYDLSLRHQGFRIGIQGPTSTQYLDSSIISGNVSNFAGFKWDASVSNLALSLAHHSAPAAATTFERKYRSAYMVIDLRANSSLRLSSSGMQEEHLKLLVNKVHAVFQPAAFGELGDLIDHLQAEITTRKEARAQELMEARKKVRRTLEATMKGPKKETEPWLDTKVISVEIKSIGVALPLTLEEDIMLPQMPAAALPLSASSVPAFLFSIRSVTFSVQRAEAGSAAVKAFSFQFVPSFDQSAPSHFDGQTHITSNRMLYPEMTASLRSDTSSGPRQYRMRAIVSGFELDLDPSITKYVFSMVDVYVQGKERIERLTMGSLMETEQAAPPELATDDRYAALPTTTIRAFLEFRSGRVRLHGGSPSALPRSKSLPLLTGASVRGTQVVGQVDFPMVTVWGHYKATPASAKFSTRDATDSSSVILKTTIHASRNQLNPTVLSFLIEVSRSVEARLQRTTYRPSVPSTPRLTADVAEPALPAVMQSLHISFSLRVDQSSLELSCAPDVLVMTGLHWDSGGFVLTVSPGLKEVSFVGAIEGITASLKHKYSEEHCVSIKARNLGFAVTFAKVQTGNNSETHSLSVVVDTEFSASVDVTRLQDILCFKAIWLDRIPVMSMPQASMTPSVAPTTPLPFATNLPLAPASSAGRPFSVGVVIRFRRVDLEVDIGPSITRLTLELQTAVIRTLMTADASEVAFSIGAMNLVAHRMLSGYARVEDFVFKTTRRRHTSDMKTKVLQLNMTSGPLDILMEYDSKKILLYQAQPLQISVSDDWTLMQNNSASLRKQLKLEFDIRGTEVVAVGTVMALPSLIELNHRLDELIEKAKMEARRDSEVLRSAITVAPQTALTEVANAAFKTARSKFSDTEWLSFVVVQHMTLRLSRLRIGLFPHTMFDPEINHFDAVDVVANLKRYVQQSKDQPTFQDLRLSLTSFVVTQRGSLKPHLAFSDPVKSASEWLAVLLKDSSETMIFKMPHMHISVQTEQNVVDNKKVIDYDAILRCVSTDLDVYITLNSDLLLRLHLLLLDFLAAVRAATDRGAVPASRRSTVSTVIGGKKGSGPSMKGPGVAAGYTSDPELPMSPPPPATSVTAAVSSATRKRYVEKEVSIMLPRLEQLGDATEAVMAFFGGGGFEERKKQIPLWLLEYAMTPMGQIMKLLLELYSKQLGSVQARPDGIPEDDGLLKVPQP